MNVKRKFIGSFVGVGAMRLIALPLGLAINVFLARILGPDEFGKYVFLMALLPLIALPVGSGVSTLLTRQVAVYVHACSWSLYKGILYASYGWAVGVSLAILGLYWMLSYSTGWIPTAGKWALLPLALSLVPFLGLNSARTGVVKGLGFPAIGELPAMVLHPLIVLFAIMAFSSFYGMNLLSALWIQIICTAITFLVSTAILIKVSPKEAKSVQARFDFKPWGAALAPFIMLSTAGTLNAHIGIFALGLLGSDEQVAALRVAERGAQFVALSLALVNLIVGPYIVNAFNNNDYKALQAISRKSARGAFLLALPIGLVMIFFGNSLIGLLFGEEYTSLSYNPLIVLVLGQLFNVFFGSVGVILAMTGHEKQSFKAQVLSILTSVFLCWLLIPKFGAVGAAVAASTGVVIWNVVLGFVVVRKIGIRPSAL